MAIRVTIGRHQCNYSQLAMITSIYLDSMHDNSVIVFRHVRNISIPNRRLCLFINDLQLNSAVA